MNYVVYQAYGKKEILNECIYSLYSLDRFTGDFEIVIYTDSHDYISRLAPSRLKISYRTLSSELISEWQGELKFVHRLKIKMLMAFLDELVDADANVLYLDTDTKFEKRIDSIFTRISQGEVFMHLKEGNILEKTSPFRKLKKAYRRSDKLQSVISVKQSMWNAGVIGFNSKMKTILPEVLELSDAIYKIVKIHSAEQLAFTIKLGASSTKGLSACDDYIFHYWNFKEYREVLNDFFELNTSESEVNTEIDKIDVVELIKPKRHYESLPRYKRELRKIVGRWKMPKYEKSS